MNDIRILLENIVQEERSGYTCNAIVTLYGAYLDYGKVKVILELMDVGSLYNIFELYRLAKVDMHIDEIIIAKIALQILCGLSYLHVNNHIHRDIKPANILVNTAGYVKLSDFGISKHLMEGTDFSKTSVGTRSYMSPERIYGHYYSYKSDIWGMGLVLYELGNILLYIATGTFPYEAKSYFELRRDFEYIGTPTLPNIYSDYFNDFISCCLQIDPTSRATALELLGHPWLLKNVSGSTTIGGWIESLRKNIFPMIQSV